MGGDLICASLQQHIHQFGPGMRRTAVIAVVDATDCNGKESSAPWPPKSP